MNTPSIEVWYEKERKGRVVKTLAFKTYHRENLGYLLGETIKIYNPDKIIIERKK